MTGINEMTNMTQMKNEYKDSVTEMITKMLLNQASLNTKSYNTAWVEKGKSLEFDYNLAASQEIAEFTNSYGYSWWSKAPQDISNCRTEIIDAVHFMLSQSIIDGHTIDNAAERIIGAYEESLNFEDSVSTLELAKGLTASLCVPSLDDSSWAFLFALAKSINFDLEHLYTRYMGKSALNAFRQQNFYKQGVYKFGQDGGGKYLKLWDGVKEDNYFLANYIDDADVPPTEEHIKLWLEQTYTYWKNKSNEAVEISVV
jgi:dimeric dUTPase (all-alpha-NTP-PPase superfamily)